MQKRKNIEVNVKKLSSTDRERFDKAKDKEISQYMGQDVLRVVKKHGVPVERILKMRWICTWKTDPETGGKKAKARLVILGFADPDALAGNLPTAAPTLS